MKTKRLREEKGFFLVLALLLLLVATLIGVAALNTTTFDLLISGNQRISEQAFYVAEAGINEFTGRFRPGATAGIIDNRPISPDWRLFLAKNVERAAEGGYRMDDPNHVFQQSLENQMDYAVEIRLKVDSNNQVITKANFPVFVATSHGFTSEGGNKIIQVEIDKVPDVDPPAPLYSKAPVQIQGTSTYITGIDKCPVDGEYENRPGIITTTPTIRESGNPRIEGTFPKVTNSSINLPLNDMVNYLKTDANFKYEYTTNQTLTGFSDSWGRPTSNGAGEPLSYTGPMNIVYFNMHGDKTLKLTGGSHGAGLLLIDGNLEINGGFTWYGVIVITGALDYTGGGEKNVSGGIMAGESTTVEVDVGGNANILFCSSAIKKLKDLVPPLKVTQWREIFGQTVSAE